MSRQTNLAVKTETNEVETVETVVLSGIDESGSWAAEKFVAEQAAAQKANETKLMPKQSEEVMNIVNGTGTKSDKIRALLALGQKRGEVAKDLNIRYQHVRNVEMMPLKRIS